MRGERPAAPPARGLSGPIPPAIHLPLRCLARQPSFILFHFLIAREPLMCASQGTQKQEKMKAQWLWRLLPPKLKNSQKQLSQ